MTKIALIGYGKMGKKIKELAPKAGLEIVAIINSRKMITEEALKNADVCIEFSTPSAALENIKKLASLKKSMVIGTTGWYENLNQVKELIQQSDIGAVYAENFTVGIQMFTKIVERAAELLNHRPEYDVSIQEKHHNEKVDSPSGTALLLANTLLKTIERKKRVTSERPKEDELLISAHRMGSVAGIHSVQIDSLSDTITLTHTAHSRDGFAMGALQAAKWLEGKKGFYHLKEIV